MSYLDRFPKLSQAEYEWILREPRGRVRCVIDTDTRNEIDDQYALAWALLSQDVLQIEAIYAAPYSFSERIESLRRGDEIRRRGAASAAEQALLQAQAGQLAGLDALGIDVHSDEQIDPQGLLMVSPAAGMELSYREILRVCEKLGLDFAGRVHRGTAGYLENMDEPPMSAAAEHLIALAETASPDDPLHVAVIGAPTNVAAALLRAPEIIRNIVVSWTAGYPSTVMGIEQPSFNMEQCIQSSQLLFDSGVPLVYLPGFHVGAQLSMSRLEVEAWVAGRGAIGDYLHWLYLHNPHHRLHGIGAGDDVGRTWIMWDLINFAWLMNSDWVPSVLIDAPYLSADCRWSRGAQPRHLMREGLDIRRDAIFRDFFGKLAGQAVAQP